MGQLVKYFAVKHRIIRTGSLPHFNSYTIVLMVVFFLQSKDILSGLTAARCSGADLRGLQLCLRQREEELRRKPS